MVLAVVGIVASSIGSAAHAQAQTGTIAGTIVDSATNAPVPAVQVHIVGSTRGALSGDDGKFTISAMAVGPVEIRASRIGYAAQLRAVTVFANTTAPADFKLTPTQVTLDQVVVTATGETQRERQAGNTVNVISADSVPKAAISTFSELITAQAPGVDVQDASGTVGGGSRVRIRGSNSISLDNTPLLVVDGIYADQNPLSLPTQLGFGVGGQTPSRLNDLDPDEIESIEVLKGPAATALYGTAGANGVLLVTTKHGTSGHTLWTFHADYGPQTNYYKFPANYDVVGINTATDSAFDHCTLVAQGVGACKASQTVQFNPLEDPSTTPFVTGSRTLFGGSVSGGSQSVRYFISGDYDNEHGVYVNNFANRNNARANVSGSISPQMDFGVSVGYVQNRLQLPENDNNLFSPILNGVLGSASDDAVLHGYYLFTPAQLNQILYGQNTDRWTASTNFTWRALPWLSVTAIGGLDYFYQNNIEITPPNTIAIFGPLTYSGTAAYAPGSNYIYTLQVTGTANYAVTSDIRGTSSLGSQYSNTINHTITGFGFGLLPGTTGLGGLTTQFGAGGTDQQLVTLGYYAQQQFAWRDKVFVTGSLRADNSSAFGHNLGYQYYPGVSASWVIGEEPWFPRSEIVSSLRLRSAFGYSGQHPGYLQAQTFFNPVAYHVPQAASEATGVTVGGFGNPNLQPERTGEFEGGFDVGFWRDRIQLQATGYAKDTRNALILASFPPSLGGVTTGTFFGTSNRYLNLGEITNRGFEIGINGTLVSLRNFEADVSVNGSMNQNKVITLGPGISPLLFGLSTVSGGVSQLITPGYPLAGFWQPSYTYSDANHDGIIEPNEVHVGANKFYGSPIPAQEVSIGPAVTVYRYFRIRALFDNHAVVTSYNSTENARCTMTAPQQNCASLYNPKTPLWEQARNVADLLGTDAGFMENASFWKWRELSVTATAPLTWAQKAHVRGLSFTLGGHNLKTWTKFTGIDPEVTFNGPDNYTNTNFFTQPLLEYWTGRIDVTF